MTALIITPEVSMGFDDDVGFIDKVCQSLDYMTQRESRKQNLFGSTNSNIFHLIIMTVHIFPLLLSTRFSLSFLLYFIYEKYTTNSQVKWLASLHGCATLKETFSLLLVFTIFSSSSSSSSASEREWSKMCHSCLHFSSLPHKFVILQVVTLEKVIAFH